MTKTLRLKAGITALAALAATGGLVAAAPGASAAGNCYHYRTAGYAQVFSGYQYTGDCFEWQIGTYSTFPSPISHNAKSMRSWGLYAGQGYVIGSTYYSSSIRIVAGVEYRELSGPLSLINYGT
ncbi:hypothetical protein [Kitasatospora sp. NPDC005856]|uniref:hypothetical protein n=1 Tax=Kitasatospora sp. NPDC005856 TaxID=3154566 RepID=UPI0033DAEDA8